MSRVRTSSPAPNLASPELVGTASLWHRSDSLRRAASPPETAGPLVDLDRRSTVSQPTRLSDDELDPLLLSDPDVQIWFEKHLTGCDRTPTGRESCTSSSPAPSWWGWPRTSPVICSNRRPRRNPSGCWPTCSIRSVSRCGPGRSSSVGRDIPEAKRRQIGRARGIRSHPAREGATEGHNVNTRSRRSFSGAY